MSYSIRFFNSCKSKETRDTDGSKFESFVAGDPSVLLEDPLDSQDPTLITTVLYCDTTIGCSNRSLFGINISLLFKGEFLISALLVLISLDYDQIIPIREVGEMM